jgi:hypothetical protein
VEEQLKSEEITPLQGRVSPFSMDGEELTPQRMDYVIIGGIEEELKSAEVTPVTVDFNGKFQSVEQLKSEEVTPKQAVFPIEYPEEITPEESIPLQSWHDLENKEITPKKIITSLYKWRELDSEEITPRNTIAPCCSCRFNFIRFYLLFHPYLNKLLSFIVIQ